MRVLVTGAAGFIGSHTVDRLLADGHDVVGLDNFDPYYDPAVKRRNLAQASGNARFRLIEGSVTDPAALATAFASEPDAVVHLAARAGVQSSLNDPLSHVHTNLHGSVRLFEAARRLPLPPRIVLASSSSVYGNRQVGPFTEADAAAEPTSPYAASKRAIELFAHTYSHLHGHHICCLRYFTVFGPRQRPDLAITRFAAAAVAGDAITLYGDGSSRRDYTYVGDIVEGTVRAIERSRGFQICNVGSGHPVSLLELVAEVERVSGLAIQVRHQPDRAGDVRLTHADNTAADALLGPWQRVPFARGMDAFWAWFAG